MLGKLLKYEFRSTSRFMWLIYAAVIVVGALMGLAIRVEVATGNMHAEGPLSWSGSGNSFIATILLFIALVYIMLLVAMMVLTTVMIILRFYRNLLQGEGYLMHTLPVTTSEHVLSKLIVALLWMLIAFLAGFLSFLAFMLTSGGLTRIMQDADLAMIFREIYTSMPISPPVLILITFLSTITSILQFYFAMAIGNLANEHKLLFSVLAYIGINIVINAVSVIVGIGFYSFLIGSYEVVSDAQIAGAMSSFSIRSIILQLVFSVVFYLGTVTILKKKLNLA